MGNRPKGNEGEGERTRKREGGKANSRGTLPFTSLLQSKSLVVQDFFYKTFWVFTDNKKTTINLFKFK